MATEEFRAIQTQEEFDKAISARLKRERETAVKEVTEKYADYEDLKKAATEGAERMKKLEEDLEAAKAAHQKDADELNAKIKGYETGSVKTRIALELGLPYSLAERLSGENEEDIRKDAEQMAKLLTPKETAPLAGTEDPKTGSKDAELRALAETL